MWAPSRSSIEAIDRSRSWAGSSSKRARSLLELVEELAVLLHVNAVVVVGLEPHQQLLRQEVGAGGLLHAPQDLLDHGVVAPRLDRLPQHRQQPRLEPVLRVDGRDAELHLGAPRALLLHGGLLDVIPLTPAAGRRHEERKARGARPAARMRCRTSGRAACGAGHPGVRWAFGRRCRTSGSSGVTGTPAEWGDPRGASRISVSVGGTRRVPAPGHGASPAFEGPTPHPPGAETDGPPPPCRDIRVPRV